MSNVESLEKELDYFRAKAESLAHLVDRLQESIATLAEQISDLNHTNSILTADLEAYEKAQVAPKTPAKNSIMGQKIADAAAAFDIRKWNACCS